MKKTYVLDTNVLIHDPDSIFNFEDNVVVIPYPVVEELDTLKKNPNGKSYAARKVIRHFDKMLNSETIIKKSYGYEVSTKKGGKIVITGKWFSEQGIADDIILKYFSNISTGIIKDFPTPVILVTKDISFRIRVALEGFIAEDYKTDKTQSYQRFGHLQQESIDIQSVYYIKKDDDNEILKIKNNETTRIRQRNLLTIIPKTFSQICAIDALLDTDIDLVVLNGYAGAGKTFLALSSGVFQTIIKKIYERVIVIRPVIPIQGTDIGYLPGDIKEKLAPWMQPIYDNLDIINMSYDTYMKKNKKNINEVVQIQALTFIRGRNLPNSFIIIDEAQNLRPLDIKTIITRAGEGTKIVFTGDLEQIDTPYLDATSSGLAYLVDRFINESNFCYLNLKETVRSRLAEQGIKLL